MVTAYSGRNEDDEEDARRGCHARVLGVLDDTLVCLVYFVSLYFAWLGLALLHLAFAGLWLGYE